MDDCFFATITNFIKLIEKVTEIYFLAFSVE